MFLGRLASSNLIEQSPSSFGHSALWTPSTIKPQASGLKPQASFVIVGLCLQSLALPSKLSSASCSFGVETSADSPFVVSPVVCIQRHIVSNCVPDHKVKSMKTARETVSCHCCTCHTAFPSIKCVGSTGSNWRRSRVRTCIDGVPPYHFLLRGFEPEPLQGS